MVHAPARDLLLVLNRRLAPEHARLRVVGEHSLLTHWLAHGRF
jgi:hypothetical protein